jgi:hypothetical protein
MRELTPVLWRWLMPAALVIGLSLGWSAHLARSQEKAATPAGRSSRSGEGDE